MQDARSAPFELISCFTVLILFLCREHGSCIFRLRTQEPYPKPSTAGASIARKAIRIAATLDGGLMMIAVKLEAPANKPICKNGGFAHRDGLPTNLQSCLSKNQNLMPKSKNKFSQFFWHRASIIFIANILAADGDQAAQS